MNFDLTEQTLEEGRVALYELEKQLRDRNPVATVSSLPAVSALVSNDARSETSSRASRAHSSTQERRILDQKSREERLNNRLESLGLTVEELDDRGLLNGGASVPSYYTSMKQKSRRSMELQSRTHRLQEREKETHSKLLNAFLHMICVVVQRGLELEAYFRLRDPDKRGLLHKKLFLSIIKSIGLPFSTRELQDVTSQYSVPSSDQADYLSLLRDARALKKSTPALQKTVGIHYGDVDIGAYTIVLAEVKRMLLDSIRSLKKHPDDVYRMFARWDTLGTNTVTATQFLRVLARLHIDLSDQDQDFLVELLDTNGMGRIDFDGLLSFCFTGYESAESLMSPAGMHSMGASLTSADDNGQESLSGVSTEGNNSIEQRSTYDNHNAISGNNAISRRPKTATLSRPYNDLSNAMNGHSTSEQYARPSSGYSTTSYRPHVTNSHPEYDPSQANQMLDEQYVRELPDDVIHGEEKYLGGDIAAVTTNEAVATMDAAYYAPTSWNRNDNQQFFSGQVNHQATEANYASTAAPDNTQYARQGNNGNSSSNWVTASSQFPGNISNEDLSTTPSSPSAYSNGAHVWRNATRDTVANEFTPDAVTVINNGYSDHSSGAAGVVAGNGSSGNRGFVEHLKVQVSAEPIDHLVLLANQILSTLRDIIMTHYRRGKSLREIFQHFDRTGKQHFTAEDFMTATADLRIETSSRVAGIAVNLLAIDGVDHVSFGEFKVYLLDSDHKLLELNVQEQLAQLLEHRGREFQSFMIDVFWQQQEEEDAANDASQRTGDHYYRSEMISVRSFVSALGQIGVVLTSSEVSRLVDRFDVNDSGVCSVLRFVRMVQNSKAWKHAEEVLAYQDEAVEEAEFLRKQLRNGLTTTALGEQLPNLPDELISMCEYLGIRVISEPNMIWIAADALKAPLPVSWSAVKESTGRTYFYNHLSNQSRLEHPLDPHFRKLRDKYRQSSTNDADAETPIRSKLNAGRRLSASSGVIGPAADSLMPFNTTAVATGFGNPTTAAINAATDTVIPSYHLMPLNQNLSSGTQRPKLDRFTSRPDASTLIETSQAIIALRSSRDDAQHADSRGVEVAFEQGSSGKHLHFANVERPQSAAVNSAGVTNSAAAALADSGYYIQRSSAATNSNPSNRGANEKRRVQSASSRRPGSAPHHKQQKATTAAGSSQLGTGLPMMSKTAPNNLANSSSGLAPPSAVNFNLRNVGVLHDTNSKLRGGPEKVVSNQAMIESIYKSPYSKPITLPSSMGTSHSRQRIGSSGGGAAPLLGVGVVGGHSASSIGATGAAAGASRPTSAIDRALGVARSSSINNTSVGIGSSGGAGAGAGWATAGTSSSKQSKLSAMFEENIIEKLDIAMVGRTNS